MKSVRFLICALVASAVAASTSSAAALGLLPDGRTVTPAGFTIPVEGFASSEAMSPDERWIAVLSQSGGAIDVISLGEDALLVDRLPVPFATGLVWTSDGLYVTRGYTGLVSRFSYSAAASKDGPVFTHRADLKIDGLLNGVAEDPATHRLLVARTGAREVVVVDDRSGRTLAHLRTDGQPFSVAFAPNGVVATLYNSDHVDVWTHAPGAPRRIVTGAHPTALLVDGGTAYVANADGHDIAVIDLTNLSVARHVDLTLDPMTFAGQTPSGMALSSDRKMLFVAESGFNDIAVVDVAGGHVLGRIPTAWYPMSVIARVGSTIDKDPRAKSQLWVVSAQGFGPQPNPGAEWNGWYTGVLQHLVVEPNRFDEWTAAVAADNHFAVTQPSRDLVPPIKHFVFIVKENKHFDEEFGDEPQANADPALLLYGRQFTPNAHALAERYALFDNFMGNGEASIYGHSWVTQGMANDYLERNAHTPDDPASPSDRRVAFSIWPYAEAGEDTVTPAQMDFDWFHNLSDLPKGPRSNVAAVFGPRGELIDELQRKGVSYRVYGEQMTMLDDGRIAPGLADNADRDYPGAHIDYSVLDTQRAKLFLDDVAAHGLAAYSFLTLPTDHTAGTKPGFYTPASYVGNNDLALGQIIEGLSKRPEWRDTVVFVTMDDAQGTGDHFDSHRMPAFAMGPYVRHGYIDHTRFSLPSVLRTVEVLFGLDPLNLYDAEATPILAAFSSQPEVSEYSAIPSNVPMTKNPGKSKSLSLAIDGLDSAAIPGEEWSSINGPQALAAHEEYLRDLRLFALTNVSTP